MELKRVSVCNLIPGMQNVDIVGVVTKLSAKSYSTAKGSGKLLAITLSDETGAIRLTLWNEEIEKMKDLSQGDVLRVTGYVRQGFYGSELRLGRFGKISRVSGSRRTTVSELQEGQKKDLRATIVQVFESNPFYEICPKCGLTVREDQASGNRKCINHGEVEPDYAMRMSGVLDDGTGAIRCVAFKETAELLLGVNVAKAKDVVLRKGLPALYSSVKLREWVLSGAVRRNKLFDRLEFVIDGTSEFDVKREIEAMLSADSTETAEEETI